jgi:hypothetical protein
MNEFSSQQAGRFPNIFSFCIVRRLFFASIHSPQTCFRDYKLNSDEKLKAEFMDHKDMYTESLKNLELLTFCDHFAHKPLQRFPQNEN